MQAHISSKGTSDRLGSFSSAFDEVIRSGAQRLLQQLLEVEAEEFIEAHKDERDPTGRRAVVRHGFMPERRIITCVGRIHIKQPRIKDRAHRVKFSSAIFRSYARRLSTQECRFAELYLEGISTGNCTEALLALLGSRAAYIPVTVIQALRRQWRREQHTWNKYDFSEVGFSDVLGGEVLIEPLPRQGRRCWFVLIAVTDDGAVRLLAVDNGRCGELDAWKRMLEGLKDQGFVLRTPIVSQGTRGFKMVFQRIYPETFQRQSATDDSESL